MTTIPTLLSEPAAEEGSYFITVSFLDEDDNAETPNADTIYWTLTDRYANVINERDYEAETSATSITIELEGDDLALQASEAGSDVVRRYVTVLWEYDSDLGNNKPGKAECVFPLHRVKRIPVAVV